MKVTIRSDLRHGWRFRTVGGVTNEMFFDVALQRVSLLFTIATDASEKLRTFADRDAERDKGWVRRRYYRWL